MNKEALSVVDTFKMALEALENNKQKHHYCEDTWYSCPKHEEGCANDSEGDECNCGADEINAQFDKAITAIKEALMSLQDGAQPEQRSVSEHLEPVAYIKAAELEELKHCNGMSLWAENAAVHTDDSISKQLLPSGHIPVYTAPPQRKPLTDEEIHKIHNAWVQTIPLPHLIDFARFIEAAHGIKEKNNGTW